MPHEDEMLSLDAVAAKLGVAKITVRRMADRGELPCYRIGARQDRRFRLSDVEAYLVQRREVGKPGKAPKEYRFD